MKKEESGSGATNARLGKRLGGWSPVEVGRVRQLAIGWNVSMLTQSADWVAQPRLAECNAVKSVKNEINRQSTCDWPYAVRDVIQETHCVANARVTRVHGAVAQVASLVWCRRSLN